MKSAIISSKGWLLFLLLAAVLVAFAQSPQGRIVGRVTDQTGAIVPRAMVTITNIETGSTRTLETNEAGDYFAPNLAPGLYSMTVTAQSFRAVIRSGIRLEVATDIRSDFMLRPGVVSETVQVTGEQPMIDTISPVLGGTLTNKAINELPLQGRDIQNLLALRPGVQRNPGGGLLSVQSNGNRVEDNNFIVDGVDNNDPYYGDTVFNGVGVQGTPATHLPLDAIQEFNTQENQGAEYGWKPGVVVNVGLKAGTNEFHGTTYYFTRNAALDARNYFNPAPEPTSALILHQFGASAGGPIIKNKWMIFGVYEGVRHKVGNPGGASSPLTTSLLSQGAESSYALQYSLPDGIAACQAGGTCNPLSLKIAQMFLPNPGVKSAILAGTNPSLINFDFNNLNREDNFVVKSDYHLTNNQVLTARWVYGNSHQTEEDTVPLRPEFLSVADTRNTVAGVNWTWTPNSRWVNQASFGLNRMWQAINTADHTRNPATYYGINTGVTDPKVFGFPRISISPFDYLGGNSGWPLMTTPNYNYQVNDNVSYVRGAHQFQFGGEFRYGGTDNYRATYARGRIDFSSLTNFLKGTVRRAYLLQGDPTRHVSMKGFGGFIRDDWRVSKRVSVSLGLRYDLQTPVKDSNNLLANFIPTKGLVQVGKGIDTPYNTQKTNFSPRAGVAWDIFGDGRTVFRAGTALIYEVPPIRMFIASGGLNLNPTGADGVNTGNIDVFSRTLKAKDVTWTQAGPVFDFTSTASSSCDIDSPCDVLGVLPNIKTPRVLSWNANLQRELTKTTVVQVAYVGQKGMDLFSHRDINQVNPNDPAEVAYALANDGSRSEQYGRPFVANCPRVDGQAWGEGLGGACFPWVGYAAMIENLGASSYNSMQVTVTQRAWRGLDFLAGYTWAHSIDNGTSNRSSDAPQDAWNYNAMRGNGDYDIRHRFTLALTYNVPNFNAPLQLLKGWQLTSIVTLQGGMPYDLYDTTNDISGTYTYGYEHWNFAGNPGDMHESVAGIPYYPSSSFGPSADPSGSPGGITNNPACVAHASPGQLEQFGCYSMGSAVVTPQEPLTFGNMPRNILRGPGFRNWDMSVTKLVTISDRIKLQFRGEVFNALNHTNFDGLTAYHNLGGMAAGQLRFTPDEGQSNPVVGSGGPRHIQLGLKVIW